MGSVLKLGRRLVSGATPAPVTTGTGILTLSLDFATAAEAQAATLTPTKLKYNKTACFMYDMDDSVIDLYSKVFPILSNMAYTDGAGGGVKYRATGALQGHDANGGEMMNGANASKFTWANSLEMVAKGWDMALHSDLHTDSNPSADTQVDNLVALSNTRYAALNSKYKLRAGIVPTNYFDYVPGFIRVGCPIGSISSQGSAPAGMPLLPQYTENKTILYSTIPTSGHYVMRRSLTDLNTSSLATEQTIIDDLVTGTLADPKIFRCFSHSEVPNITENIFSYVRGKPGDVIWVPTLREFAEFSETRAGTTITKTVSGTRATFTLDQSTLLADVRWRDASYTVAGGTTTNATLAGGKGLTFAGNLVNVYNSDVTPTGISASVAGTASGAGTTTTGGTTTGTTTGGSGSGTGTSSGTGTTTSGGGTTTNPPAYTGPAPASGPTAQLAYNNALAYSDSNTNDKAFLQLFDGDLTTNADFGSPINPTWKQTYPFPKESLTRLDYILLRDQNGMNTARGVEYVYGLQGETTENSLGFFTGPDYGKWQTLTFPALTKPVAYVRSRNATGQVQPAEIQFFGAQVAYTAPLYQPVPGPFLSGVTGNWYDFVSTAQSEGTYGALNPAKAATMDHLGIARIYVDQNDLIRSIYQQATAGVEVARIAPEFHGANYDAILADRRSKGLPVRLCVTNVKASLAATWPQYVDTHPYVAAYTDANGVAQPEQPARPWLNDVTIQPRAYTADPATPAAWAPIGQLGFNLTARYGKVVVAPARTWWSTVKSNSYDSVAPTNVNGQDLVDGFEWLNELNEAYKGISQYLRVEDEAMMCSVIRDGHKGALAGDYCMDAADPSVKFYGMGVSKADPRRYRALMAEFARIRGYRADGSIDTPIYMHCFHEYPRDPATGAGIPLEVSDSLAKIVALRQAVTELAPGQKLSLGEIGYADQADSTGYVNGYVQGYSYCPPSASYTTPQRIAHWSIRNILVAQAAGVDETILYTTNRIASSDAVKPNWDTVNGLRNSPTEYHVAGVRALLAGYLLQGWTQNPTNVAGQARAQRWTKAGQPDIYIVWMGSIGETTASFTLTLPGTTQLTRCVPQDAAEKLIGTTSTISGTYSGTATEQPTFYYLGVPDSAVVTVAAQPAPAPAPSPSPAPSNSSGAVSSNVNSTV